MGRDWDSVSDPAFFDQRRMATYGLTLGMFITTGITPGITVEIRASPNGLHKVLYEPANGAWSFDNPDLQGWTLG